MSTAALIYVNMATKVMFKSSKIVVVMLMGALVFGTRYTARRRRASHATRPAGRSRRACPRRSRSSSAR